MICFKLFPVIFMWWKVYELYLLMKGLICNIISGWLLICLWFNATAIVYWKHFSSLLLRFIVCFLFFSHLKESIHDPPWFKLIFYDTCNIIDQRYEKQVRCLSLFLLCLFDICVKKSQKVIHWFRSFHYQS